MPDVDRYPSLSRSRRRSATFDDVLVAVRAAWPDACQRGSTGFEREFVATSEGERRIVAHSWSPTRHGDWHWLRVAVGHGSTLDADDPCLTPDEVAARGPAGGP